MQHDIIGSDGYPNPPAPEEAQLKEQTRDDKFKAFIAGMSGKGSASDIDTFVIASIDKSGQLSADSGGDLARVVGLIEFAKKVMIENGFNINK